MEEINEGIFSFFRFEDLKKWQLWDVALSVLTNAEDKQVSRDVGEKAVILLFATLSWDINRLVTEQEPNKAVSYCFRFFCSFQVPFA